jgi:endonuclease/exonuclease/phosphatase family metal-dependent hydrolase
MKLWTILLIAPVFAGCGSCDNGLPVNTNVKKQEHGVLRVATWNVQALFDGAEDGYEYEEYVDSAGWTKEKYLARLNGIAHALGSLEKSPDILTLVEVEKSQILEDLANSYLKDYGYHWSFFGNNDGSSLGIGVLSRFPFSQTRVHSLSNQKTVIPRPVLEVWVTVEEESVALFLCHWKSKLGGEAETEEQRRAAARVISRRVADIRRESVGVPVVVMGDLNENYDEFYRQGNSYITALLPDDAGAAALVSDNAGSDPLGSSMGFLVISREKPPAVKHFPEGAAVFYSPWASELSEGSYNYRDVWETIDHFLLNESLFDSAGWDFDTCAVMNVEPFINSYGYPSTYNPKTGNGLSDHLPMLLTLKILP